MAEEAFQLLDPPGPYGLDAERLTEDEKLIPNERQIVIVTGYQGSGKSLVANKLNERIGAKSPVLRTDVIRKDLFPLETPDEVLYTNENKAKVYTAMFELATKLGKEGPVVLDATFWERKTRQQLQEMADKAEIKLKRIYVVAPDANASNWLRARLQTGVDASTAGETQRSREATRFQPFQSENIVVNNSGDKQQLLTIVDNIVAKDNSH